MEELRMPGPADAPERTCPRCGGQAALHARMTRAIHDWEITFVRCLRLRCCGQTFTTAPTGLTPRSRYSVSFRQTRMTGRRATGYPPAAVRKPRTARRTDDGT